MRDTYGLHVGEMRSTYNADYVPPALQPGYMGHCPSINLGFGSTFGGATKEYFQDYRNEILTYNTKPEYLYGNLATQFSPLAKSVYEFKERRSEHLTPKMPYRLTNCDPTRRKVLDIFYQSVQNERKYYKDRTGKVLRPREFVLPTSSLDTAILTRRDVKHLLDQQDYEARESGAMLFPNPTAFCDCPDNMGGKIPPVILKPPGYFRAACACKENITPTRYWPEYCSMPHKLGPYPPCNEIYGCHCPLKEKNPDCPCEFVCNRYCYIKGLAPRPRPGYNC